MSQFKLFMFLILKRGCGEDVGRLADYVSIENFSKNIHSQIALHHNKCEVWNSSFLYKCKYILSDATMF